MRDREMSDFACLLSEFPSVISLLIETCRHLNTRFCSASNYSVYFLRVTHSQPPGHQLPHLFAGMVWLQRSLWRREFLPSLSVSQMRDVVA